MRIFTVLLLTFSLIFFAACPDRAGQPDASADESAAPATEAAPISEDQALEAADEVLKEIDSLE